MDDFENKLIIKEEDYENGLFPKIPNFKKKGSAFILTGGNTDDLLVNECTTAREIRKGRFNKLVEISTRTYLKELRFEAPSKEKVYSFEVYVKGTIQVMDPICFWENRNIDVDAYFDNIFSLDVRKITCKYGILNYTGLDEELKRRLSTCTNIDETTGFRYQISVVEARPGEKAKEYIERFVKQELDAKLRKNAKEHLDELAGSYEEAILTEVVEGKRSEVEAREAIEKHGNKLLEDYVKNVGKISELGIFTEKEERDVLHRFLDKLQDNKLLEKKEKSMEDDGLGEFFSEDNES